MNDYVEKTQHPQHLELYLGREDKLRVLRVMQWKSTGL